MKTRIVAGLVAALLLTWLVWGGPQWLICLVVCVCSVLAYLEFDRLFFPSVSRVRQVRVIILVLINVLALSESTTFGWIAFWFSFVVLGVCHVFNSNRTGDFQKDTRELSLEVLGCIYVISLFGFMVPITQMAQGRGYLYLLFLIVFVGDTVAYFVGSRFGKRTLAQKLSPKKTLEGAVGALFGSVLVAYCWCRWAFSDPSSLFILKIVAFAPLASALAQAGDLFESLFKRSQSQKDSGHFLPGHGGLLDRIDGLALVSPVYYVYLMLVLIRS